MCGLGRNHALGDQVAVDGCVSRDSDATVSLELAVNGLQHGVAVFDGTDEVVVDPDFHVCGVAVDCDCGVHYLPFVVVDTLSV